MAEKKPTISDDVKKAALSIVDRERTQWEDAVCYVTERVGFKMRELIRILRKNYWGVFDEPIDPITGREKIWIHLIMSTVEDIVKSIDLDAKDIGFRASGPKGYALTDLTRAIVKDYLEKMFFGEILDETERQLCIDGTVVWKTWKSVENGVIKMNRRTVDLLHIYIDPTEDNIQSAYRFTERGLMLPDQVKGMSGWMDKDVKGDTGLDKNDSRSNSRVSSTAKLQDVWETWGKIPKWIVPGEDSFGKRTAKDAYEEVDGHIVVSGLETGDVHVHLIERNKNKDNLGKIIKPYEEVRASKITGRWYGLGPAERILALQEWLNTVDNIRINRSYISQLGLFKIRKGQGITPQMLAKLPSNGAIAVNQMDDIEQLEVQEVGESSYKDEEVIKDWATKVTSAYPNAVGEPTPASTSATAVAIQNSNAKTAFTMMKEGIGMFLQRWMDRHALPIIASTLKVGDIVRFSADDDAFKDIVERVVSTHIIEELDAMYEQGQVPTMQAFMAEIQKWDEKMKRQPELFTHMTEELIADHIDTVVEVTNEELDVSITVQNLMTLYQIDPTDQAIKPMIYDLLGLPQPKKQVQAPQGPQQAPQGSIPSPIPPTQQSILTNAATTG